MTKRKLQRFAELETFERVFQPKGLYLDKDHEMKGTWRTSVFRNQNRVVLELGCGRGEYTVNMSQLYPDTNFIGIDIKGARLWRGAKTINEQNIINAAFMRVQVEQLAAFFEPGEVNEIWITFPDPQPMFSRENRRLTAPRFLKLYQQLAGPEGIIHLKTDNAELYLYTLELVTRVNGSIHKSTDDLYSENVSGTVLEITTTYEKKFLTLGMKICYLKFSLPEIIGSVGL